MGSNPGGPRRGAALAILGLLVSDWRDTSPQRGCPVVWKWSVVERLASVYLGCIHLGFGLLIMLGGAIRFPPPTYQPLLDLTVGHVWPYGLAYLTSALFLIGGHGHLSRMVGAIVGILANSCFAALFLVAVFMYPDAGATAWWAYLAFATQSAALAALMWTHRGSRNREG